MSSSVGRRWRPKMSAVLWGVLYLVVIAFSQAAAQNAAPVSFALKQSRVTLHEPVYVEFAVQNDLAEAISFDLGLNRKTNLELVVTEPTGSVVYPPRFLNGGFGRSGHISVEPGRTFKQDVLVNEFYQFLRPGAYRVRLKLTDINLRTASGRLLLTNTASPAMVLEVGPRDARRLTQECQSLTETARSSPGYQERADAVFALSYVLDPVAIPYLRELAKGQPFGTMAVYGLARIASVEGIQQVLSRLGPNDTELEASIRSALNAIRLGAHTAD